MSRRLIELYAVGVGLALAVGVERMVDLPDTGTASIRWTSMPTFVALLPTLITFYHGALRHLHLRWIEERDTMRPLGMMADLLMLVAGVTVLIGMAFLLTATWSFAVALMVLLVVDCLWAVTFRVVTRGSAVQQRLSEMTWLWLNLGALLVGLIGLAAVRAGDIDPASAGSGSASQSLPWRGPCSTTRSTTASTSPDVEQDPAREEAASMPGRRMGSAGWGDDLRTSCAERGAPRQARQQGRANVAGRSRGRDQVWYREPFRWHGLRVDDA
jgi:hypothetical protein